MSWHELASSSDALEAQFTYQPLCRASRHGNAFPVQLIGETGLHNRYARGGLFKDTGKKQCLFFLRQQLMEPSMNTVNNRFSKRYVYKDLPSPVGVLRLVGSDDGLAAILWEKDNPKRVPLNIVEKDSNHSILLLAEQQLKEYFAGQRELFVLPLDFAGTDIQNKVWQALLRIPFGKHARIAISQQRLEILGAYEP